MYVWGGNLWSQRGEGGTEDKPTLNSTLKKEMERKNQKITQIACGSYHSMALDSSGMVYSWGGYNRKGES